MTRRRCIHALVLLLGTSLLLLTPSPPRATTAQSTAGCISAPEAPGPADQALAGSTGELSLDQKHAAFTEVLATAVRYGDYTYPVAITQSQQTAFYPILLKSVAGIESNWTQYKNGQTLVGAEACDFGLMQINEQARAALFSKHPSLRSDTRGNIAAAAQTLSELWSQGLFGTLPLVNDGDPTWLPNWYYVLSTYNGGPGAGVWVNNPACGSDLLACRAGESEVSYALSHPIEGGLANWDTLSSELYPYQERVLYNLPFARKLSQHPLEAQPEEVREWQAAGLGFKGITGPGDTGMRPEDSVFVRRDPTNGELVSFAPNLLLFRHRASAVRSDLDAQGILFEYDLPFSALVTITLQLEGGGERPLCTAKGLAGWNQHYCRATTRLQNGDSYRIRAERGSPDQPASYYLGQYLQQFTFADGPQQIQGLAPRAFLPLVQRAWQPVSLLNSRFSQADPSQDWKPDYWDTQALFSRQPGSKLSSVTRLIRRSTTLPGWRLGAVPDGVVELRQRLHLEPGSYLLKVRLNLEGADAASVLSIRTRPAVPGPQPWSLVASVKAVGTGPQDNNHRCNWTVRPRSRSWWRSGQTTPSQPSFCARSSCSASSRTRWPSEPRVWYTRRATAGSGITNHLMKAMTTELPQQVQSALDDYIGLVNEALPGLLEGLYLHGSLALDAYTPGLSDIDFIAVTSRRCAPDDIAALRAVHDTLRQRHPDAALEGSYLQRQDLGLLEDRIPPHPHIHDGVLHPSGYHDISGVTWWLLKHRGVAVLGAPPDQLGIEVDWDDLIAKMHHNLNTYWASFASSPRRMVWLLDNYGIQWAVLGVLRQFYTFRERAITSKIDAGRYGLLHTPPRWHRLIQEAIDIREGRRGSSYRLRIGRALAARAFLQTIIAACDPDGQKAQV